MLRLYGKLYPNFDGAKKNLHEQEEILKLLALRSLTPQRPGDFEDLLYTPLQKNRLIHLPLEGEKSLIRRLPVNIPIPQNWRIWIYGCFRKWWYPQIIHFKRVFPYRPSILGYPYFGNTHMGIWDCLTVYNF